VNQSLRRAILFGKGVPATLFNAKRKTGHFSPKRGQVLRLRLGHVQGTDKILRLASAQDDGRLVERDMKAFRSLGSLRRPAVSGYPALRAEKTAENGCDIF
jgi:hypothetical protein